MITNRLYPVTNNKGIIDLNEGSSNFELTFTLTSQNKEPFYAFVTTNDVLKRSNNNDEHYKYKFVENGVVSGTVKSDTDNFKQYYLLLKSDNNCEVNVKIEKTLTHPSPMSNTTSNGINTPDTQSSINNTVPETNMLNVKNPTLKKKSYTKWIVIAIVIIMAAIYIYYTFFKKETISPTMETLYPKVTIPTTTQQHRHIVSQSSNGNKSSRSYSHRSHRSLCESHSPVNQQSSLVDRLNSLPLKS